MKKLFSALLLLFSSHAYALPCGNPAEATLFYQETVFECFCFTNIFSVGVGFYGDYVFNRHMQTTANKDIDTTKLFTNAGYLALNICRRIDIFTALGASRLSINTSLDAFNAADPHPLFELESGSAFSYSVGARATLYTYKCASLGVEGQYFATKPNVKRLYIAAGAVNYPDDELHTRYSEWQVGGGLSYRYNDYFVPYVAVKYARSFWKLNNGNLFIIESNNNTYLFNLRNQKTWGYAIGLTLCPLACEQLAVTAEVRFSDEKALYVNGQIRF
jgi:major outer membrane protein